MNDNDFQTTFYARKKRWTESEKKILLQGLKKHGSQDIKKLKQLLPHKSITSITNMIRKYQAIAELGKKEINSPLDVWLRSGIFSEENNLVPEAILFISLFENHPPPEETAGFDLREAYKLLYEALKGQIMTMLPQKTGEMFRELVLSVDKEIWPATDSYTTDYLMRKLCVNDSDKSYKKRRTC